MFSSAVLILMLDSFLFSLMTGTQVPDDGDRRGICAIAWTQGAVATGMLAAGATALFGGLGWMLASHTVKKMPSEDTKAIDFVLVYVRTRALRKSLADTAERTQLALRSIKVATVCMVVLAIGASWLAVTLARLPKEWLTAPNNAVVMLVLVLTYVFPTIVSTAICYSVASTDRQEA